MGQCRGTASGSLVWTPRSRLQLLLNTYFQSNAKPLDIQIFLDLRMFEQ